MTTAEIGRTLKKLRLDAGFSQKQAYEYVGVAQSTFSSWEIGKAEPPVGMLLKLCQLYKVTDVFAAFGYDGYNEDGSIQLSLKEQNLIEKYRSLDSFGQETVNYIIDRESSRTEQVSRLESQITIVSSDGNRDIRTRIYPYLRKIAAAGVGFYFDDIPTETLEAPFRENADFIIGVSGDSMEPSYYDGDLVYVQKQQVVDLGDVGIFIVGGECYIKEAGECGLISHNQEYETIPGSKDIICVGKVLGKVDKC